MAFKLSFKLPTFDRRSRPSPQTTATGDAPAKGSGAPGVDRRRGQTRLTFIGDKPVNRQLQILGTAAFFFLVLLMFALWQQIRTIEARDAHRAIIADMRVFSQVIGKGAIRLSTLASAEDFGAMRAGRGNFDKLLDTLLKGAASTQQTGGAVPPVGDDLRPAVDQVARAWAVVNSSLEGVLGHENALTALAKAADKAGAVRAVIAKLAADRPAMQDMARAAGAVSRRARATLLLPPPQHLEAFDVLRTNIREVNEQVETAMQTVDGADRTTLEKAIADLNDIGTEFELNVMAIDSAKERGDKLQPEAELLAVKAEALFNAIGQQAETRTPTLIVVASGTLVLLLLVLMLKVYNDDTYARQQETERQRRAAEAAKDATQEAILRLMNEMGDLADGDLTVRATVSEDITGAIADSVNYTVEELGVLVRRINEAAVQVAAASDTAQQTSGELLEAAERQLQENRRASEQVLEMAQSMNAVSGSALESASVARQSLEAAQKGAEAVENSIKGMNEIRGQIQETSKRIKRLGESSQEIGEIVELISDITEQTNVLALNAAIQAAAAGEAGRGFTVVAEEVQRLAERSGEATKQIAAIVKTIQADTHDAVSAMEHSTRGVVEGAKLSDAAGQALEEISNVSKSLAELIARISADTQHQASVATSVATAMEGIRQVTDQTTEGTKRTAVSISQLANLAAELKGSVSGFKV